MTYNRSWGYCHRHRYAFINEQAPSINSLGIKEARQLTASHDFIILCYLFLSIFFLLVTIPSYVYLYMYWHQYDYYTFVLFQKNIRFSFDLLNFFWSNENGQESRLGKSHECCSEFWNLMYCKHAFMGAT